jgi:hypothetical protein
MLTSGLHSFKAQSDPNHGRESSLENLQSTIQKNINRSSEGDNELSILCDPGAPQITSQNNFPIHIYFNLSFPD